MFFVKLVLFYFRSLKMQRQNIGGIIECQRKELMDMLIERYILQLKERLIIEFEKQDRSGVYGFTQCSTAYNSNKIEGSTLTEKQTASIFETGTLFTDDIDTIFNTKDIEEMTGHFKMFNFALTTIDEPLSEKIICKMHKNLKEGVFEDVANGYAVGAYKTRANRVNDLTTALPVDVPERMQELLEEYHTKANISLHDIAAFHAKFENMHPFQDGNGRVGRMIIFRECLHNGIIPVIIKDTDKTAYLRYLNNVQLKKDLNGLTEYFRKEQINYMEQTADMLFDYRENVDVDEMKKELENI